MKRFTPIPAGIKLCQQNGDWRNILKPFDVAFPQTYFNDLRYIASLYNANLEIRPYSEQGYAGGYNYDNRLCYINVPDDEYEIIPTEYAIRIFCHELAHHIQRTILFSPIGCLDIKRQGVTLEEILLFEQEADNLGFELECFYFSDRGHTREFYIEHFATDKDLIQMGVYFNRTEKDIVLTLYKLKHSLLHPSLYRKNFKGKLIHQPLINFFSN